MGIQDKAKHLATMYLEDISDLIKECLDDHFGFSRYAEKLGRSANSFDELYNSLNNTSTFVDEIMTGILQQRITEIMPALVAISVPFPGNLYAALRCGQWIKKNHPAYQGSLWAVDFRIPNCVLSADPRVFEFIDFITLDDGEAPVENLIGYVQGLEPLAEPEKNFHY